MSPLKTIGLCKNIFSIKFSFFKETIIVSYQAFFREDVLTSREIAGVNSLKKQFCSILHWIKYTLFCVEVTKIVKL